MPDRPDFVFFAAHKSAYEPLDKFILERSKLPEGADSLTQNRQGTRLKSDGSRRCLNGRSSGSPIQRDLNVRGELLCAHRRDGVAEVRADALIHVSLEHVRYWSLLGQHLNGRLPEQRREPQQALS